MSWGLPAWSSTSSAAFPAPGLGCWVEWGCQRGTKVSTGTRLLTWLSPILLSRGPAGSGTLQDAIPSPAQRSLSPRSCWGWMLLPQRGAAAGLGAPPWLGRASAGGFPWEVHPGAPPAPTLCSTVAPGLVDQSLARRSQE